MLAKPNRIKKKKDFETIFKNSRSLKNSLFILRVAKNDLGLNRFGFVVSQKVSKKAVVRNKVKRRLSEVVRGFEKSGETGADVIFIALPGIKDSDFPEIRKAVENAFVKINLKAL